MILLALAAAMPATAPDRGRPAPPAAVTAGASATVRILHSASASANDWSKPGAAHKREILIREADGKLTPLRIIEYE